MARLSTLMARVRARSRRRPSEEGFTVIEMVVAIAILAIALPAFANGFMVSTATTGEAQLKGVAVTLADSALDKVRTTAPSMLLANPALTTPPTYLDVSQTSSTVTVATTSATLDGHLFTTSTYAGTCYLQPPATGQTTSLCTASPANFSAMVRLIAAVTWTAPGGCVGGACSYVSTTLLSNFADSQLETNPNVAPAAPTITQAAPGVTQATISWSAPASTYPVTGYVVSANTGGASTGGPSCSVTTPTPPATTCTLTGLTGGATYTVTVTAISEAGTSAASAPMSVTPYTSYPTAPTGVAAAPVVGGATISWAAESVQPPVTSYVATAMPGGQQCTATSGATTCPITGLTYGTNYTVTVTATSPAGTSPASAPVPVTPAAARPSAPTGVTATAGESDTVVAWTAVTSSPAVTGYLATAMPGGQTCSWTSGSTACTITGLTDGDTYTVTVTATSAGGTSVASTAVTTIPYPASILTAANGLSLWLDGADATTFTGDGCSAPSAPAAGAAVPCWGDKGGANDAVTQSSAANRPVLGSLNGHTALTFVNTSNGSTDQYLTSTSATGSYQTVLMAVAPTSGTYNYMFQLANLDFSVRQIGLTSANINDWDYGTNKEFTNGVANAAAPNGATSIIADVSSVVLTSSVTIADSATGTPWAYRGLNGTLGEVIAFKGTLTAAQLTTVETYLANKWG